MSTEKNNMNMKARATHGSVRVHDQSSSFFHLFTYCLSFAVAISYDFSLCATKWKLNMSWINLFGFIDICNHDLNVSTRFLKFKTRFLSLFLLVMRVCSFPSHGTQQHIGSNMAKFSYSSSDFLFVISIPSIHFFNQSLTLESCDFISWASRGPLFMVLCSNLLTSFHFRICFD